MLKPWNWAFGWKCSTPTGTFLPQILGPKNKLEKGSIIQGTLVMSAGTAIIEHTGKFDFLLTSLVGFQVFIAQGIAATTQLSWNLFLLHTHTQTHTHTHTWMCAYTYTLKNVKHPLATRIAVKLKLKLSLSPQLSIIEILIIHTII